MDFRIELSRAVGVLFPWKSRSSRKRNRRSCPLDLGNVVKKRMLSDIM
jgi:hypothetical protein